MPPAGRPSGGATRVGKGRVRKPGEQDAVGCRFAQDGDDGFAEILLKNPEQGGGDPDGQDQRGYRAAAALELREETGEVDQAEHQQEGDRALTEKAGKDHEALARQHQHRNETDRLGDPHRPPARHQELGGEDRSEKRNDLALGNGDGETGRDSQGDPQPLPPRRCHVISCGNSCRVS